MATDRKIRVAIVGLGFGAEFIPIYQAHPNAEMVAICRRSDKGELGRLQFLRGSHQQDMDGWPNYWPGLPPMHYATHCVSPCLALLGKHAESVVCHGSGRIREELIGRYGSPFALETATFKIRDSDVVT